MPLVVGTERCWSGCTTPAVGGTRRRVRWPLGAGTWWCCSGRGSTAARGGRMRCVKTPLRADTWMC